MIAFLFSPIGKTLAGVAGLLVVVGGIYFAGDRNGASRIQLRFDAYKVQVQMEIAAEQARQRAEAAAAIAALETELSIAEQGEAAAKQAADALRDALASRPVVEGRGATEEDVDALNR